MRRDREVYIEGVADIFDEFVDIIADRRGIIVKELGNDLANQIMIKTKDGINKIEYVITSEDLEIEKFNYLKSNGIIVYDRVSTLDLVSLMAIREEITNYMNKRTTCSEPKDGQVTIDYEDNES